MATAFDFSTFDDRREPRYATSLAGTLLRHRHRDEIRLENVSRSGALVSGDRVPEKGTEVVLQAGAFQVVATVSWASEHACGLMFHRAIEAAALRRLRAAA